MMMPEARLISALSPLPLDGVISKASPLMFYRMPYLHQLNSARRTTERTDNLLGTFTRIVVSEPNQREILRFMSNGYQCRKLPSS